MILVNNRPILVNSRPMIISSSHGPTVSSDMDFLYFAKDLDGAKIPNSAPNSTFGDYLVSGTLTSEGSGSDTYLVTNIA